MSFSFSDEQLQFRASVAKFFERLSPPSAVREHMRSASGYDRDVWARANTDLGLSSIQIPESYGGAGFGFVELCMALEEMGRCLYCAPFFSSAVLAANAIMNGATEAQKLSLLPRISSGESIVSLALTEIDGSWASDSISTRAAANAGEFVLNGQKKYVLDGMQADTFIVVARLTDSNSLSMFLVEAQARGLHRTELEVIDPTRRQAALELENVRAELLGEIGGAGPALEITLHQGAIALANEMVGGCQALLDAALEYAKLRMQFGRLIGSFQAIKHQFADMLLDVEQAKSAAYYAAAALDARDVEIPALAALAKAVAADTYVRTATKCIQIHGGIGFTWDNDTHLWFKRAKSSELMLGSPTWHRERYMQAVEASL